MFGLVCVLDNFVVVVWGGGGGEELVIVCIGAPLMSCHAKETPSTSMYM